MEFDGLSVELLEGSQGIKVGRITLNNPASLNALSLSMIQGIRYYLGQWQHRDDIACLLLDSDNPKAFCAGGDIRSLHGNIKSGAVDPIEFAAEFFAQEYEVDYLIKTYPKPVLAWGNGVVMGGGIGIYQASSHRVVTPTSRLAMPEITIGLFPDVGGSWFLNRFPGKTGLFAGLTGVHLTAEDARFAGIADYYLSDDAKGGILESVLSEPLSNREPSVWLSDILLSAQKANPAEDRGSALEQNRKLIDALCEASTLPDIVESLLGYDADGNKWLQRAQTALSTGCPATAHIVFEQIKRASIKSLKEIFEMELVLAARCCASGDFVEGIRALLIDKDRQPDWRHASVAEVSPEDIQEMFTSPWEKSPFLERLSA